MYRSRFLKISFIIGCLSLLYWGTSEIYEKKTRFGLVSKFTSPTFKPSAEWDLPILPREQQKKIDDILSQKFTFFARGSQAYAFVSEDQKYILKLFKQHKWHPKNLLGYIPLPLNPFYKDYLQRQKKQWAVLDSCKTALIHVHKDTGVIFAHLNPAPLTVPVMTIVDKRGKAWTLDLSKSCFLLQKKADLFYPHIQALMKKGDIEGAKYALTSTFQLLNRFMDIGVFDNNAILRKNFGFIDNEAMQFDIGKFKFDASRTPDKREIRIITERFHVWVEKNYPELLPHFDSLLAEHVPIEANPMPSKASSNIDPL